MAAGSTTGDDLALWVRSRPQSPFSCRWKPCSPGGRPLRSVARTRPLLPPERVIVPTASPVPLLSILVMVAVLLSAAAAQPARVVARAADKIKTRMPASCRAIVR